MFEKDITRRFNLQTIIAIVTFLNSLFKQSIEKKALTQK